MIKIYIYIYIYIYTHKYQYIYIYIYPRVPTELEVIYLGFTYQIIQDNSVGITLGQNNLDDPVGET